MRTPVLGRVLEANVDWVTATYPPNTTGLLIKNLAARWLNDRAQEGYPRSDWTFRGFLGERTDGISYGERTDSFIVRLSGQMAKEHGQAALKFAQNVSRLDLQVTINHGEDQTNWAMLADGTAANDARCQSGMTKRHLVHSNPGGSTFYLGSRSSDRYFRVYDKAAESEGLYPANTWRWEVEYKADRALRVGDRLRRMIATPEECRQIVEQAFQDYRITLPCEPLPRGWRDAGFRQETDDQRRLQWLERSVGPMVSRLLETLDPHSVLLALGLDAYADLVMAGAVPGEEVK